MNPLDFPLLADENIAPAVVAALRERHIDVRTASELGLVGASDSILLARATAENRVIVTHDADFGLLTVRQGLPLVGVIFLRPGHIDTSFVLQTNDTLRGADVEVEPPFLIVAEHRQNRVLIRLRRGN
jgi:predicted nuclease of predicted toxin-antitoxin system